MSGADPILALRGRMEAQRDATARDNSDAAVDARLAMADEALKLRPTTRAGAIAALEWAAEEIGNLRGHSVPREDDLILSLIGGAADLLREQPFRVELAGISGGVLTALDLVTCAEMATRALDRGEPIATVLDAAVERLHATNERLGELIAEADKGEGSA